MSEEAEAEEDSEAAAEEADDNGGVADGDFVKLGYTVKVAENGEVVDTTDREIAEEEGFDVEEREFGPRVVVVGGEELFDAVDSDLVGKEAGASGSVHIPAEDAFGEYDQEEVRTVSADRIPEDDRYPGAHVDIDGQHGHVETIIGGRARVDFNHPLAGDDLEYEYEVTEVITDPVEKAKGLLKSRFDVAPEVWIETDEVEEEVTVEPDDDEDEDDAEPETELQTVEKQTLYIESVPQLQFDQQWMFGKQQVAQDLIERLGLDRVIVQEVIDAQPAGPMGGMPGMMGGAGGEDLEAALDEAEVDAEELVEDLEE